MASTRGKVCAGLIALSMGSCLVIVAAAPASDAASISTHLLRLTVSPSSVRIAQGSAQQFVAVGTYQDGSSRNLTASVVWSSSNGSVATVSNVAPTQGLATATDLGTTMITAAVPDDGGNTGKSGSATLTVTTPALSMITVSPAYPVIAAGTNEQFTATGTYSDGSTKDVTSSVTWTSSITSTATISNASGLQGLATGVGSGTTTITATAGSIDGSTGLKVTCQSHQNGLGQTYADCSPLGTPGNGATYSATMAAEAANAWAASGTTSVGTCGGNSVIVDQTASSAAVWGYTGSIAGFVYLNSATSAPVCPTTSDRAWN